MVGSATDSLAAWLADRLGVSLVARTAVSGGCIHSAWCLELAGGARLFAKTNRASAMPMLEAEADGLAALAAAADPCHLVVPAPRALGLVEDQAVLVLPWLDLDGVATGWRELGAALAALHRRSLEAPLLEGDRGAVAFGWRCDNFIGSSPQANGWLDHWGRFFAERRLQPQLEWVARRGGPLRGSAELLARTPHWLGGHAAEPVLVHGDLWSGNAALLGGGRGTIFDPAVHRADREVDLAMAHLFGGFPEAFFAGYEASWSLPAGHERRRALYNLYHLLNHANLFGGSYRGAAQASIDRLLGDGGQADGQSRWSEGAS
jgi:fructosamine-3-kinase